MIKSYSINEGSSTKSTVQPHHFELNIDNRNKAVKSDWFSSRTALSPSFCSSFALAGPYVAGAMAGGIASVELVTAFSNLLAIFLWCWRPINQRDYNLPLRNSLHCKVFGINLLHSPNEPELEEHLVDCS